MSKQIISSMIAVSAAMVLVGCGGSNTSNPENNLPTATTVTGIFQDANVAGLNYACSSGKTDVTTGAGEYTCNAGDTVTFSLGAYELGAIPAFSGVVTPMALFPDDLDAVTDVLQLLQTLDSGADGTITIPDNFTALDAVATRPGEDGFDTVMEGELGKALVSEADAQAHMLTTFFAGQTFYTTIYDEMGTMESWSFNADMTEASWTEMVGGDANGRMSIDVNGMTMTATCTYDSEGDCDEAPSTIEVKEILADYVVVEVSGGDIDAETETLRLYFDEAKARAYLLEMTTTGVKALFAGKTFYTTIYTEMGTLESMAFSADMTTATWTEMVGGDCTGSGSLSVNGKDITFTSTSDSCDASEVGGVAVLSLHELMDDYMLMTFEKDVEQRLYFEEAKARAYFLAP